MNVDLGGVCDDQIHMTTLVVICKSKITKIVFLKQSAGEKGAPKMYLQVNTFVF